MPGPYFFLSYARLDRGGDSRDVIKEFHERLAENVRALTGEAPADVGAFLDTAEIEVGDQWPDVIASALRTCRAFVPVLSPTYLRRPYCGREWTVFRNRVDAAGVGAQRPDLIVPVLLVPPHRLKAVPKDVERTQQTSVAFPELYSTNGLLALRRSGKSEDYEAFVAAFANRLVELVEEHPLAPGEAIPPFEKVADAFQAEESPPDAKGPQWAAFMLVAGRRDELETVRTTTDAYGGTGGYDWLPYLPAVEHLAGQIAIDVARKEDFYWEFLTPDEHAFERIDEAVSDGKIVAVLADTWTLGLERYKQEMTKLDGRSYLNCIIVVVWNEEDSETVAARAQLETVLKTAFPTKCAFSPETFISVKSADDLKNLLSVALHKTRERMVGGVDEPRKVPGEPMSKPEITVHGAL